MSKKQFYYCVLLFTIQAVYWAYLDRSLPAALLFLISVGLYFRINFVRVIAAGVLSFNFVIPIIKLIKEGEPNNWNEIGWLYIIITGLLSAVGVWFLRKRFPKEGY